MAVFSAGNLSPDPGSAPSLPRSSATFGHADHSRRPSTSSEHSKLASEQPVLTKPHSSNVPEVNVNGAPLRTPRPAKNPPPANGDGDETAWGSNFWVTLVDPQVC